MLVFGLGGIMLFGIVEIASSLSFIGIAIFPIPLAFVAFLADKASRSLFLRALIVYCFWCIVLGVALFTFCSSIGGVSMAVADGIVDSLANECFVFSMKGILYLQPIIILFTAIGTYKIKRRSLPQER